MFAAIVELERHKVKHFFNELDYRDEIEHLN